MASANEAPTMSAPLTDTNTVATVGRRSRSPTPNSPLLSSNLPDHFESIEIADDARLLDPNLTRSLPNAVIAAALLQDPARYGPLVRKCRITEPGTFSSVDNSPTTLLQFEDTSALDVQGASSSSVSGGDGGAKPLPSARLYDVLRSCVNLEVFEWCSSNPPPDGLCETLSVSNTKTNACYFIPPQPLLRDSLSLRQSLPRWDAPSLQHLFALPLTTLHIHRLSQAGSKSLISLFERMGEFSNLEDVWLDFLWLDDSLCDALASAGRRLKRLRLTTSGTKLTDKGLMTIMEKCDALEELGLFEVQGRLSRGLWGKIPDLPLGMKTLRITTSETGPHHSWTIDHLNSLPSLSLDGLDVLSITRGTHPCLTSIDDLAVEQAVPRDLLDRLKEDSFVATSVNLDWWGWSATDLKDLLTTNPQLEELSITFDAPLAKLLTLSSTFANMQQLRTLRVRIPESHAPGVPVQQYHLRPQPTTTSSSPETKSMAMGLITPAASPVNVTRGIQSGPQTSPTPKSSSLPSAALQTFPTPPTTPSDAFSNLSLSLTSIAPISSLDSASGSGLTPTKSSRDKGDPSSPNPRDIQKFVRRCPKLETLEWYGRNGRGSWTITRDGSSSAPSASLSASTASAPGSNANTVTVKAEHTPPHFPSLSELARIASEKEAEACGWEPGMFVREGHEWEGPAADRWKEEQRLKAEEKEREREEAAALAAAEKEAAAAIAAANAELNVSVSGASSGGKSRSGSVSGKKGRTASLGKLDIPSAASDGMASSTVRSGSARRRASQSGSGAGLISPTKTSSGITTIYESTPTQSNTTSQQSSNRSGRGRLAGGATNIGNGAGSGSRRASGGSGSKSGLKLDTASLSASTSGKRSSTSGGSSPSAMTSPTYTRSHNSASSTSTSTGRPGQGRRTSSKSAA